MTKPSKLLLCVVLAQLPAAPSARALEVGDPAPDFTLTDIVTLESFSLSDFHGRVTVINFWAYW